MPLLQAVVLAILQGLTEFLPISSSAHLALAPWLLGWRDQGLEFDIALHIGTLLAVAIYFFRDWMQILAQGFGRSWGSDPDLKQNRLLLWFLVVATLPVGLAGLFVKDYAETTFRSPFVSGTMLILVALLMLLAERRADRGKNIGQLTLADSLVIGAAQALALVPGTSRSGITIVAGLFRNVDRAAAARFSFLLSTPAVAAAGVKSLYDLMKNGGLTPAMQAPFFVGIAVSGITGLAVIAFLLRFLRRHSLTVFAVYRIVFGIIVIALAILRA